MNCQRNHNGITALEYYKESEEKFFERLYMYNLRLGGIESNTPESDIKLIRKWLSAYEDMIKEYGYLLEFSSRINLEFSAQEVKKMLGKMRTKQIQNGDPAVYCVLVLLDNITSLASSSNYFARKSEYLDYLHQEASVSFNVRFWISRKIAIIRESLARRN